MIRHVISYGGQTARMQAVADPTLTGTSTWSSAARAGCSFSRTGPDRAQVVNLAFTPHASADKNGAVEDSLRRLHARPGYRNRRPTDARFTWRCRTRCRVPGAEPAESPSKSELPERSWADTFVAEANLRTWSPGTRRAPGPPAQRATSDRTDSAVFGDAAVVGRGQPGLRHVLLLARVGHTPLSAGHRRARRGPGRRR